MRNRKEKTTDFKPQNRPDNRLKQYFDIFSHRFLEIMKISLLEAIFAMPLLATLILAYAFIRNASNTDSVFTIFLIQACSFLITIPILFVGLVGVFTCFKKIAFADNEYTSSAFFYALKSDWYRGLLVGFIQGLSMGLCLMGTFFFMIYPGEMVAVMRGLGFAASIIQLVIITICSYYSLGQIVCYNNKMIMVFKNSFLMMMMKFPTNLLFIIIHPGIYIALCSIMEITMYVGVVLFLVFSGVTYLIWSLATISAFDKFINKQNYPDIYRKGLYNKEESNQ